jgi:hypothetical protein
MAVSLFVQIGLIERYDFFERDFMGRVTIAGPAMKLELLNSGAYGWLSRWESATRIAHFCSSAYGKRHRVFWSREGRCWMIRRAYEK